MVGIPWTKLETFTPIVRVPAVLWHTLAAYCQFRRFEITGFLAGGPAEKLHFCNHMLFFGPLALSQRLPQSLPITIT